MKRMVSVALVWVLTSCGTETALPLCAELVASDTTTCRSGDCAFDESVCDASGAFAVEWSHVGTSDSIGVPYPVECTETISHPCPFLLYTQRLVVDGSRGTWTDATGGADGAGVQAENRLPWVDDLVFGPDRIVIPQRGDDGGLRHESVLKKTETGYEGSVSWHLFTVAGETTFAVVLTRL